MSENNIRTMEFIGVDDWARPVYKCLENDHLWKDVNLGKGIPNLTSCGDDFDGEPDSPIREDLEVVFSSQYEENPYSFTYQMLDRMRQDCEYYLGYGNRNERSLCYGNVPDQITEMKKLYNDLPEDEKPEWLSYDDILNYEKLMTS